MLYENDNEYTEYVMSPSQAQDIADILRSVYDIVDLNGGDTELLEEFIMALDNAECICIEEDQEDSEPFLTN